MTIYSSNQLVAFYRDYGLTQPPWIPNFEKMLVKPELSSPQVLLRQMTNAGNITVVYGRANCGKTPICYAMAWAMASGSDLDPIHTKGSAPQSCLILSGELNPNQWGKFKDWNERTFPTPTEAFVEIAAYPYKLDDPEGQRYLEDAVRYFNSLHPNQKPVSVIFIDNIKTLTSAGDNASSFGQFFDFLNKLRDKHGWTFIVVHHTHKGKDDNSFGTYDIDIKVDNKIYIGRNLKRTCDKFDGIEAYMPPEEDKEATKQFYEDIRILQDEWTSGKYKNSIWFYMTLEKGRDFKSSEKRPILMRMLPEDEQPKWEALDFLDDGSSDCIPEPTSPPLDAGGQTDGLSLDETDADTNLDADDYDDDENDGDDGNEEEKRPTYGQLLNSRCRETVLECLRKAFAEGFKTRSQMAQWLGCTESQMDNLMNNEYYERIVKEDLKA